MKKGINVWAFKSGTTALECIKTAKKAGYDGVEFALDETGEVSLAVKEQKLLEIKSIAKSEGIELPSVASGLYWKYSLTSDDKMEREKAKDIVKKQLETAAILGADTILVVPGMVACDFVPSCHVVDYDVAYNRSLEALTELKTEAEKLKVSIGIENVWNKFLLSPLEMRDFVDKIASDYVGAYLDIGNLIYIGYPEQWIKILGKRIKKVHFKDFNRNVGNINGFVDLLSGNVNFPKVVETLNKAGYTGYVTGEVFPYSDYSDEVVYRTSNAMDRILSK